jgi:quinoprotein glucose dehydrogenase
MNGGVGPTLVNAGQRLMFNEFKSIITEGKGRMPAFVHVDDQTLFALYRYLGGTPAGFRFGGGDDEQQKIDGPVIASGGATIPEDESRSEPMKDYPDDIPHPVDRYTTDYGTDWQTLVGPPWATLTAYDLNVGTIKWRKPIGLDSALTNGDKTTGAPGGTIRKGMVTTSTGVVFATGKGGVVYAFDADDGSILWETTLSNESSGQPIMFEIEGKQYLVINASFRFERDSYDSSRKPGALPKGYIVYALPDDK